MIPHPSVIGIDLGSSHLSAGGNIRFISQLEVTLFVTAG